MLNYAGLDSYGTFKITGTTFIWTDVCSLRSETDQCKRFTYSVMWAALLKNSLALEKKEVENETDEESACQPRWSPRYTAQSRKPAAPVSKVNGAHRQCCHRAAPPDLSSSPPILRLAHPVLPFFECVQ